MSYSRTQIVLHWLVVVLIAVQFLFHDGMEDAWRAVTRGADADPGAGAWVHVGAGLAVLALTLWRLVLRATHGAPPAPQGDPAWQRVAASVTHWGIYALLVLTPLSGMAAWFGGVDEAGDAHETLKSLLLLLIVAHIGAALFHQLVRRDGLMRRMSLRAR